MKLDGKTSKEDLASIRNERFLYGVIWLFVAVLPVVFELWVKINGNGFDWKLVTRWWAGMIPLLVIFLLHNRILIPRYMKKGRMTEYLLAVLLVLSAYGVFQYSAEKYRRKEFEMQMMPPNRSFSFEKMPPKHPPMRPPMPGMPAPHRPFPFPLLFNLLLAAVTLGINVAISLAFTYSREQSKKRELENKRLQEELKYLKQQISPHFLMNVLNNIHELAEEDSRRAQDMILELSHLMRYVLYDSENDMTTLAAESRFISSYVALMKMRYVEDLVNVRIDISVKDETRVPPLLFISFIENAFKHGVSYSNVTEILIKLHETDGKIVFICENTLPESGGDTETGGVGLANIRRRLDLIYGDTYSLRTDRREDKYSVTLIIPSR